MTTREPQKATHVVYMLRKAHREGSLSEVAKATKIPLYRLRDAIRTSGDPSSRFLTHWQVLKLDNYFNKRGNDHADSNRTTGKTDRHHP